MIRDRKLMLTAVGVAVVTTIAQRRAGGPGHRPNGWGREQPERPRSVVIDGTSIEAGEAQPRRLLSDVHRVTAPAYLAHDPLGATIHAAVESTEPSPLRTVSSDAPATLESPQTAIPIDLRAEATRNWMNSSSKSWRTTARTSGGVWRDVLQECRWKNAARFWESGRSTRRGRPPDLFAPLPSSSGHQAKHRSRRQCFVDGDRNCQVAATRRPG
ncbi:MAG: hypothetical protein R3B90_13370 [Planctomycetaceae bacterium]